MLYDELISVYKKEYNQTFKNKDEDLRQTYDYKNLKDLDYQTDEKDRHKTNYTKMWKNKMIKDIASGRIDGDEAINMHVNTIGKEF